MKIALANPPWYDEQHPELWGVRAGSRWPHFQKRAAPGELPRYVPFPFFMAIAAQSLKQEGHEVLLLDGVAENSLLPEFFQRLENFHPEVLFLETSTPSLGWDLAIMHWFKRRFPSAILAAAGTHAASLVPALLEKEGLPDYWIAGEYEQALGLLAAALERKTSPEKVPGLITRSHAFSSLARIEDVNRLPAPLFEQLPMSHYGDPVCGLPRPGAQSWISRGCPYGCTFCVWPQVVYGNRRYRQRSIPAALDEVRRLIDAYGCESFYFDDDTANIGEARMKELADSIHQHGLSKYPWSMMARADCMTPSMIDALAGAGLYSIKYGVESSSPELLDACHKGTDLARMRESIRLTKENGIKIHLTFTFGVPGETRETIRQTLAFAMETAPDTAQFSICTPFPGTVFYEDCRKNGWLAGEDWTHYLGTGEAVVSTPQLSAAALQEGYEEACAAWNDFSAQRLEVKRDSLLARLKQSVREGRRWRFMGDREFAGFLWESGDPALEQARTDSTEDHNAALVIVSRHDEEKIWRGLRRQNPSLAQKALRLFG
ncbi:MAG: radical SAM protein [Lentisphaerota bacterium]